MSRITKRVFALLLSAFMALTIIPVSTLMANAASTYTVNGVSIPIGKYTNNGPCYMSYDSKKGVYYGNCWAFAQYVYKLLWPKSKWANSSYGFLSKVGTSDDMLRKLAGDYSEQKITENNTKNFISFAELGAVIRIQNVKMNSDGVDLEKGQKGHSLILIQKDSKGFTTYDSNVTVNKKKVTRIKYWTWKEFANAQKAYTWFKYIKWPGAPAYTANSNVTVTLDGLSENTNTYVKAKASFNTTVNLQQVTYIYSTDASKIVGKNFVANTSDLGLGAQVEGVTFAQKAWTGSENLKSITTTIPNLKPNTTYYYCLLIKADGKWWQSTTADSAKCGHFTTANNKPETPVLAVSKDSADIGIGGTVNLSWNDCKYNSAYDISITKDGREVYTKEDIQGTLLSIPGEDVFTAAGTYTAVLTAKNPAGSTISDAVSITVHDDVTVSFYDADEQLIYEKTVHYGESVDPPETPYKEGYDFIGWKNIDEDKAPIYESVTEDTELVADYKIKEYTVVFVNGETNEQIGETQKVEYTAAAAAPDLLTNDGFVYSWDTDFSCVKSDLTVTAISSWYNQNYPLSVSTGESTFVRDADGKGYDYSIKITRDPAKTKQALTGRLVIALKTTDGYMFAKTDSAAFNFGRHSVLDNNYSEGSDAVTVKGFVACENAIADVVEVYTVGSYEKAGALAAPASITPDNTNQYTWRYVSDKADIPENAIDSPEVTLYRYRQKITVTSYATSLEGYIPDGYELKESKKGTVDYVKAWQTYNKTGTALYNQYNKTPVKASENDTSKTVVSESQIGYIYWHWCKSGTKTVASGDAGDKGAGFTTLHQFYKSDGKLTSDSTYPKMTKTWNDACSRSPYWWNNTDREHSPVAVYRQTYTVYNKLYKYYKWSEWSEWSADLPPVGADFEEVAGYQYKIESAEADAPAENSISNYVNTGNPLKTLDAESFAGKQATVFIHKYTEPADFTNEYVTSTTVNEDGSLDLGEGYLREVPSAETGDFTIVASIEGQSAPIEIGSIKAPKAQLEVKFKYETTDDDEHAIRIVNIEQGDSIAPPEESAIAIPEGMYLKGWSQSTANIQDNLVVTPVFMPKTYVVVFIDWGKREFSLDEYQYGDSVTIPEYTDVEGKTVDWDLSKVENDGDSFIVKGHTVITTVYAVQENEAKFILPTTPEAQELIENIEIASDMNDNLNLTGTSALDEDTKDMLDMLPEMTTEDLNDLTGGTVQEERTDHGDYTDVPDEMDNDEIYLFYGWKSLKTGEFFNDLTSKTNDVYYPVYDFGRTVDAPYASVETGEYPGTQNITLSCDTENAVIYYTLDGSDPRDADNANAMEYAAGSTITITKSTTLQAFATAMNHNDSDLSTYLYAIGGTYHVLVVYNDSNLIGDQAFVTLIKDGGKLPSDAYPPLEGHTFAGIYLDSDYTESFDCVSEAITEDFLDEDSESGVIALFAHYVPDSYTVTFKDADGHVIKEVTATYGTYAEEPDASALAKDGYVFVGWDNEEYTYVTGNAVCTARYVPEDEYVKVSFKRSKYSIIANSSKQLSPVLTPGNMAGVTLSWSTDNADVAQVDYNGVVTGVAPGTAVITATVDTTGESASVTFTITADAETSIVLSPNSYLKTDADGDIRRVDETKNTVDEIKDQFATENLKFFDASGNELAGTDRVGTGTVVLFMNGEEVVDRKVFIMTGDADGDGEITNKDSAFIAQLLVGKKESSAYIQKALDVNGDGDVNVRDASMLAQFLVGKATFTA